MSCPLLTWRLAPCLMRGVSDPFSCPRVKPYMLLHVVMTVKLSREAPARRQLVSAGRSAPTRILCTTAYAVRGWHGAGNTQRPVPRTTPAPARPRSHCSCARTQQAQRQQQGTSEAATVHSRPAASSRRDSSTSARPRRRTESPRCLPQRSPSRSRSRSHGSISHGSSPTRWRRRSTCPCHPAAPSRRAIRSPSCSRACSRYPSARPGSSARTPLPAAGCHWRHLGTHPGPAWVQRCAALQAHPSRRRSLRQGEPTGNAPCATAAAMSTGVVISAAGFSASNILRPPARDRFGRPGRGPGQHTYLESVTSESASESAKSMTDSREP